MSPQQYADMVATSSKAHPCKYGHLDCAAWDGGPCVDEVLGRASYEDGDEYIAKEVS
jgi:hypothetical protein